MSDRTILVVEDDAAIRQGVADALQSAGYSTVEAADAAAAMKLATAAPADLMLLDLILPGGDGLDVLRHVRAARPQLPVIVLTARGAESDRVRGLQFGADDYVVKPFSVKELLARVAAVLRRSPRAEPATGVRIRFPGGAADLDGRTVRYNDGSECELSDRETDLLRYLSANAGRCVGREEILANVWGFSMNSAGGIETRTIDMHVARLREKLRDDAADGRVLRTVRGKGYLFAELRGGRS